MRLNTDLAVIAIIALLILSVSRYIHVTAIRATPATARAYITPTTPTPTLLPAGTVRAHPKSLTSSSEVLLFDDRITSTLQWRTTANQRGLYFPCAEGHVGCADPLSGNKAVFQGPDAEWASFLVCRAPSGMEPERCTKLLDVFPPPCGLNGRVLFEAADHTFICGARDKD